MKPFLQLFLLSVPALCLLIVLTACGTLEPPPEPSAQTPRAGLWSLEYTGDCAGREAERLQITQLDKTAIVFGDFTLLRDAAGQYSGTADRIAPMPADGREIGYTITYALTAAEAGAFAGTETVVEGGGHGLDCPIQLRYLGED